MFKVLARIVSSFIMNVWLMKVDIQHVACVTGKTPVRQRVFLSKDWEAGPKAGSQQKQDEGRWLSPFPPRKLSVAMDDLRQWC